MSHFLDDGEIPHRATYLRRLRAAVQVTHSREGGDDLLTIVPGSICVLRVDAQLAPAPARAGARRQQHRGDGLSVSG